MKKSQKLHTDLHTKLRAQNHPPDTSTGRPGVGEDVGGAKDERRGRKMAAIVGVCFDITYFVELQKLSFGICCSNQFIIYRGLAEQSQQRFAGIFI